MESTIKRIGSFIGNRNEKRRKIVHIAVGIMVIAVIALLLFKVIFGVYCVTDPAMSPTIENGAFCLMRNIGYGGKNTGSVQRGDLVVFDSGENACLCRRAIAIGGDTVLLKDGYVFVNGEQQKEKYLIIQGITYDEKTSIVIPEGKVVNSAEGSTIAREGDIISYQKDGNTYINETKWKEGYITINGATTQGDTFYVPEGSIFVLGDNRENAEDSRTYQNPYIDVESVKAKVLCSVSLTKID